MGWGWLELHSSVLGWSQMDLEAVNSEGEQSVLQDWSLSTRCHYYCSETGITEDHWGKQPRTTEIRKIKWQKDFNSWAGGGCPSEGCSLQRTAGLQCSSPWLQTAAFLLNHCRICCWKHWTHISKTLYEKWCCRSHCCSIYMISTLLANWI